MTVDASRTAQPRTRAPKAARRGQLIEATLETIEKKGLPALTLADVSKAAGMSRGIVNFHFESKERLLYETLRALSDEYSQNWRDELARAGGTPAERLRTLIAADLAERVATPAKVAAWFAFSSEAVARPDYRDLCWARDDIYLDAVRDVCAELDAEGRYGIDADTVAAALYAMQEGLWLKLMHDRGGTGREGALRIALAMLGTLFPKHFTPEGDVRTT